MFNFGLNSRRLPTAGSPPPPPGLLSILESSTAQLLSSSREGSSFSTRSPAWSGAQRRRRERWWRCLLVRVTARPRSRCQYILAGAGQTCGARRQARTCRPQSGGARRSDSRSSWAQRRTLARRAAPHPLRCRQPRCPNLRAEEGELGGPRLPDRVCPVSHQVPCLNSDTWVAVRPADCRNASTLVLLPFHRPLARSSHCLLIHPQQTEAALLRPDRPSSSPTPYPRPGSHPVPVT